MDDGKPRTTVYLDPKFYGAKANDNVSDRMSAHRLDEMRTLVAYHFRAILETLGIDHEQDHNTEGTANRVAKMYVDELFAGRYLPRPKITDFPNVSNLDELYCTGPITVRSMCSHHFVPIHGRAWVGILPSDKVIGLSKFNRLVQWIAARPQIQEEMTVQIADEIEAAIQPRGVAVVVKATHHCMVSRGVREHSDAVMTTSVMRGLMRNNDALRAEFLALIR